MKILLMAYDFRPMLGGVATCSYELALALNKIEGVEVTVMAKEMKDSDFFDQSSPLRILRYQLPSTALFSIPKLSLSLISLQRKENFTHIINMLWMPEGLATYLAFQFGLLQNAKYYTFAHGVEILESHKGLRKKIRALLAPLKRKAFLKAQKVLSVSDFTAELLQKECSLEDKKIHTVFNGVNTNVFSEGPKKLELAKKYKTQNRFTLLTISRLEDYKGVDTMIKAMAIIPKEKRPLYLIGGVGPDKERLESLVKMSSLEADVFFCGKVPDEELVDHYNLADLNVLLSRYDSKTPNFEGFGLVFLEAAACRVPSLAGNSGGIPSAVIDQETGLLVNPEDPEEVATKLLSLIEGPELLEYLASNSYQRATKEMTWDHMAERVIEGIK